MKAGHDFGQPPYMIVWETTRACALACRHCRAEAQPKRHPEELTTAQAMELIAQVERAQPQLFIFTGGDPMLRPDLLELIQRAAASKTFRVAISPSATPQLLKTDFKQLKQAGAASMSISLDGADEETHNAFRGSQHSWDWTMEAIRRAQAANIALQINTTITPTNWRQLDSFRRLLDGISPMTWSLFMLVPTGRGRNETSLHAQDMEDFFVRLFEVSCKTPYQIKTTEGQHYRRVFLQRSGLSVQESRILGLNDGKGFVFVSHTGEIHPSGFLPIATRNVKDEELIDVYRHHPLFRSLRDSSQLKGKCGRCEFNGICGGSRARAYAMTGDFLAAEPLCSYQPQQDEIPIHA
ncbi:MAG: radical SAM protein [bacterium]